MLNKAKIYEAQQSVLHIQNLFNKAKDETNTGLSKAKIRKAQQDVLWIMSKFGHNV